MGGGKRTDKVFVYIIFSITIGIGIVCEGIGIHMLYKETMATIGTISFSAAMILLIIGLILILAGLAQFHKSNTGQNPGSSKQNPMRNWLGRNWVVLLAIVFLTGLSETSVDTRSNCLE